MNIRIRISIITFLCVVLFGEKPRCQNSNGISLNLLQFENYEKEYTTPLKPVLNLGIGYDRYFKNKIGVFLTSNYRFGNFNYLQKHGNRTTGTFKEINFKYGFLRTIRILERLNGVVKLNGFHEIQRIKDGVTISHSQVRPPESHDYKFKNKFRGIEVGFQPEFRVNQSMYVYCLISYQYGVNFRQHSRFNNFRNNEFRFNYLESVGLKLIFPLKKTASNKRNAH